MTVGFQMGRSVPPTAPCGADNRLSRSVFHGAFSAGDGDAAHVSLPYADDLAPLFSAHEKPERPTP